VNKVLNLFIIFFIVCGCSLNKNSKFWTKNEKVKGESYINYKEIFPTEEALKKEFNSNLIIKFNTNKLKNTSRDNLLNNYGQRNFNQNLTNSIRYKFSKIKNFHQYEPKISFFKDNIIFFDNKGSILQFDDKTKLIWKKNYYSKSEKKSNPILQFANNGKYLIIADNLAKYYMLDIQTGNLVWAKDNLAPFNSQIKIYKDKFFIIDFSNTLRCFSLKDGKEIWNIKTENNLIKSQKKLSMVIIKDTIYFNNTIGDISAVELNEGELIWQIPTQSNLIYQSAFSLETSEIISDSNNLFFSNNKNQIFSINVETGNVNWENNVNSNVRPVLIDNYLISVSLEGYLIITDKTSGNILRVTDMFKNFKSKDRINIKPTGIAIGLKNIYISTNNGRLLVADILSGKIISTLKIDNDIISEPFIQNDNLFLIKDNAIIKLK